MSLSGWDPAKKIQIVVSAADIPADLVDFPVLVNLSVSSGKTGYDATAVFTDLGSNSKKIAIEHGNTGNQCYCEIELWDPAAQKAVLHVKVPSVSSVSDTVLYLYYDALQPDNTTYIGLTGEAAAQSVWDANFMAVYHMAQDPAGVAPQILDSTANANHGTCNGSMTSSDLVDGLVGKAISLDGVDDYINCGNSSVFDITDTVTLEAVFTPGVTLDSSLADAKALISRKNYPNYNSDTYAWYISIYGTLYLATTGGNIQSTKNSWTGGTTYYVAGTYNATGLTGDLYVDGSAEVLSSDSYDTISSVVTNNLYIGSDYNVANRYINATIGEVRISNIIRSDAWVAVTNLALRDILLTLSPAPVGALASCEQRYDLVPWIINAAISQVYSISSCLRATTSLPYGLRMLAQVGQPYAAAPVMSGWIAQYYGRSVMMDASAVQPYADAIGIVSRVCQSYAITGTQQGRCAQGYSISGSRVDALSGQIYSIRAVDRAVASAGQPYTIADGAGRLLGYAIKVSVAGTEVRITGLTIEASMDRYCLSCDVRLASQADYVRCRVMDDLVIAIDGQEYRFFVEARQRRRGHEQAEYTINGLSRTALLDEPYTDPVTGELSGTASQIVAGLASGYSIDWRTVDWHIPPGTMMPGDQTPLQVIRQIAAAAGAVIQTDPDGTMVIEPAYPVPVTGWDTAAVQYTLSDADDFLSLAEEFDHRPGYNRFLVSDQLAASDRLRLEEEAVSASRKIIRAYQVPWEGDFGLRHTGGPWVAIEPLGIEERVIEDEVVEFVAGEGRTRYPIIERVSMEWLRADLGSVIFSEDGALLADAAGESLLRISYRARCRKYLVTDTRVEQVQIVAEEVS